MTHFILECALEDGGTYTTLSTETGAIAGVLSKVPLPVLSVTVHEWIECRGIRGDSPLIWKKKGQYPWRLARE